MVDDENHFTEGAVYL